MAQRIDTSQYTEAEIDVAHILLCMSKSMDWNSYEGTYVRKQEQPIQQNPVNRSTHGVSKIKTIKSFSSMSKLVQNKENRSLIPRMTTTKIAKPRDITPFSTNSDLPPKPRLVMSCYLLPLLTETETGGASGLVSALASASASTPAPAPALALTPKQSLLSKRKQDSAKKLNSSQKIIKIRPEQLEQMEANACDHNLIKTRNEIKESIFNQQVRHGRIAEATGASKSKTPPNPHALLEKQNSYVEKESDQQQINENQQHLLTDIFSKLRRIQNRQRIITILSHKEKVERTKNSTVPTQQQQ